MEACLLCKIFNLNDLELNKELVNSIRHGKELKFRTVFYAYFNSLEVFAKAYVVDGDVAKDMVQDVFYKLWKKRATLPENLNLKAYLYQATKNNCLNYLKHLKVKETYENRMQDSYNDLLLNYEALSQLNFDKVTFQELSDKLNESISNLPPKCREVFELSRFEGYKNRKIAEQLNISIKAVEGHISKALKQLKSQLEDNFPSGFLLYLLISGRSTSES